VWNLFPEIGVLQSISSDCVTIASARNDTHLFEERTFEVSSLKGVRPLALLATRMLSDLL
jgi:hypothetical protein